MKTNQLLEILTEQTVLYVWVGTVGDGLFSLEEKLEEYGIKYTDDYHSSVEGACEINLSENKSVSQKTWDSFMKYLKKNKATFQINSKF